MSDSDQTSSINYELLVEDSLRTVVRGALAIVQEYGLLGESHFYITFRTQADGVQLDDTLKEGNPQEMTIVLQHQFWDLTVEENQFSVGLSFSGVQYQLVIPFSAVTHFTDPSVGFGLQFSNPDEPQKQSDSENSDQPVILREVMQGDQKKLEALDQKKTKQEVKNALDQLPPLLSQMKQAKRRTPKATKQKLQRLCHLIVFEKTLPQNHNLRYLVFHSQVC